MPPIMSCINGEPLVPMSTKVPVTEDWLVGRLKFLNWRFIVVPAVTSTTPVEQTARPPRAGWIVAFWKPAVVGAWTPAGMAPPGFDGRKSELYCADALAARASAEVE